MTSAAISLTVRPDDRPIEARCASQKSDCQGFGFRLSETSLTGNPYAVWILAECQKKEGVCLSTEGESYGDIL